MDFETIKTLAPAPSEKLKRPDALLVFHNRTAIVQFQLDKQSEQAVLQEAKTYAHIANEFNSTANYTINVIKFIGVNVRMDKTVRVCGELLFL